MRVREIRRFRLNAPENGGDVSSIALSKLADFSLEALLIDGHGKIQDEAASGFAVRFAAAAEIGPEQVREAFCNGESHSMGRFPAGRFCTQSAEFLVKAGLVPDGDSGT